MAVSTDEHCEVYQYDHDFCQATEQPCMFASLPNPFQVEMMYNTIVFCIGSLKPRDFVSHWTYRIICLVRIIYY